MLVHYIIGSTVDYPDNLAHVLFVNTCNYGCHYCHNKDLKNMKGISLEKIRVILREYDNFVDHIVISGGEPTFEIDTTKRIIDTFIDKYRIGIHTNGSFPDRLKSLFDYVDFIGMDLKGDEDTYKMIPGADFQAVCKSLEFLKDFRGRYEIRSTYYEPYFNANTITNMIDILSNYGHNNLVVQKFMDGIFRDTDKLPYYVNNHSDFVIHFKTVN